MKDAKANRILSLATTVGSEADARRLAQLVLERRLAACVQIDPAVVSHYVWQGSPREEAELRLTIKTLPDRLPALQALFDEQHPYELPQFLATVMDASEAYAGWVRDALAAG